MTDWFQSLMSGFGRAVQIVGANQAQQEQQAQQSSTAGQSLSGTEGVAALLGSIAAHAGSSNTEQLRAPMTITGTLNLVVDTAFIVLYNVMNTPAGGGAAVPAIVARVVPGQVYQDIPGDTPGPQLLWGNPNYNLQVPLVYWDGTAYAFVPSNRNIPANATPAVRTSIQNMNLVGAMCRTYFQGTGPTALLLQANAPTSDHYFRDVVFTLQAAGWRPVANPNAPVVRQALFAPGRRRSGTSNLGNIYHEYDHGLRVTVQWVGQNSWSTPGMVARAAGVAIPPNVLAFEEPASYSGMLLQPGFVAGLIKDVTGQLNADMLAYPGYPVAGVAAPASQLFVTNNPAAIPLHYDYDGNATGVPAWGGMVPLVQAIAVPPAVAITPNQPGTLILSRIVRAITGPWAPQGGVFPIGGGMLTPLLPPTTVFADAVRATTWADVAGTALQPNNDNYLTLTPAGARVVVSVAVGAAPVIPPGNLVISMTTTNGTGVIASVLSLPITPPFSSGPWIESFSINVGNLVGGEMNRVLVQITQPNPNQWQAQVTLNGNVGAAAAIVPTQIQMIV